MWTGLMLFVGSYIFCVCMLHALKRPNEEIRSYHLLLVTKDNQLHIEWYIRSLFFLARFSGKSLSVSVIDEGSTDDTLRIAEKLSRSYELKIRTVLPESSWEEWASSSERDNLMVMHVSNQKQLVKLPLFE
ncbi:hypothetical protein [Paenibacillus chitinolyticus]|uniref:hypothetical protein n=1 Tax=Paenibacillus chitinolyticus TaxID=79263 RepID=UPI003D036227